MKKNKNIDIAHEMRTHLSIIGINADNLQIELKKLQKYHDNTEQLKKMEGFINNIRLAIKNSCSIIDKI